MASYEITLEKEHPTKFAALVKFNGGVAEYYEVESLEPKEIDRQLMAAATELEAQATVEADIDTAKEAIVVQSGKIKLA